MKTQVILGKGKIMTGKRKASPIPLQFLNRRDMYTDLRARAAGDEDDGARCLGPGGVDAVEGVGVSCGHWTI
jgi:hypothetical protein